jgi:SAM-dependent methyltransferase
MSQNSLDYNTIAPTYNRRFISDGQRQTACVLRELVREVGAQRILEAGCGTGHWLNDLAKTGWDCFGLDRSSGMLSEAAQHSEPIRLVQGQAETLPFGHESFDLLYCVNAIHHFTDQARFVEESWRLLSPGGALAVTGMVPHGHRDDWYVYEYFDGTYETDLRRFPTWGQLLDWMAQAGFRRIELRPVETILEPKVGRAVLDDPFLQKHAASQLALLSDEAYAARLRRIHQALQTAEQAGRPLIFMSMIRLDMLVGWK